MSEIISLKGHHATHYTTKIPYIKDSGLDPFASPEHPFQYDNPATEKYAVKIAMKLTNTNVTLFKLNGANWTDNAAYHPEIIL